MKRASAFLLCILLFGCASPSPRMRYGGVNGLRVALVTVEVVNGTDASFGRGYIAMTPLPIFPFEMLRAGITGEVVVRLAVEADGHVREVSVVRSSQREFEPSAVFAAQHWRITEVPAPGASARSNLVIDYLVKFGFDES